MATANQDLRELKQEMQHLADLVKGTVTHTAGNGDSNLIGFDAKDIKRMARKVGRTTRSFLNDKSKQAVELRDTCEESIVSNPFKAVALAVTGGLLLSALLRRR